MTTFINYIKDVFAELKHISWPTTTQSWVYTVLVIIVSIVVALLLAGFDFVFSRGLDWFLQ